MARYSEAQNKATQKYQKKAYENINFRLRKGETPTKEDISAAADAVGESVNGYIKEAIKQRIKSGK